VEHGLIDPFMVVRAIHIASTVMVAGAAMFAYFVAEPAFRSVADASPRVAGSFRAALSVLLLVSLGVAVVSGAGWWLLLAGRIGDHPLSEAITDGTAWLVLTQTRFGIDWQLRSALAVLLAANVLLKPRPPARWRQQLAALGGIALVATLAWAGHGGATPGSAGHVHLAADVLHLGAAGAWLGGLIPLVLLLRLLRHSDDPGRAMLAWHVTRRFSNLGVVAVGTLLTSGMINAWFLVGGTINLVGTEYGRLLELKIALFFGMVILAAANRLHLMPQFSPAAEIRGSSEMSDSLMSGTTLRLEGSALLEIFIGLAIICIVGVLGVTPPAAEMHLHVH
jgi:putative copper resistance protein D